MMGSFFGERNVPISDSAIVKITSLSVEHTVRIGHHLGKLLRTGDVICLAGDLGAGKTALTRGIGAGWGTREAVTSPTFTLIHEHHREQNEQVLYHVDCYRLSDSAEAWGIGLEDMLYGDGVIVIEWPENIQSVLPPDRLWVQFSLGDDTQRHLVMTAASERYQTLLAALRRTILEE